MDLHCLHFLLLKALVSVYRQASSLFGIPLPNVFSQFDDFSQSYFRDIFSFCGTIYGIAQLAE
jgi:hypothetical protein